MKEFIDFLRKFPRTELDTLANLFEMARASVDSCHIDVSFSAPPFEIKVSKECNVRKFSLRYAQEDIATFTWDGDILQTLSEVVVLEAKIADSLNGRESVEDRVTSILKDCLIFMADSVEKARPEFTLDYHTQTYKFILRNDASKVLRQVNLPVKTDGDSDSNVRLIVNDPSVRSAIYSFLVDSYTQAVNEFVQNKR